MSHFLCVLHEKSLLTQSHKDFLLQRFPPIFFPLFFLKSVSLFLAMLGLHCCMGFSSVAESGGYSLAVLWGLPTAVAPRVWSTGSGPQAAVVVLPGFMEHRRDSCALWA